MKENRTLRHIALAAVLLLGVIWSLASAQQDKSGGYPNGDLLATAQWLETNRQNEDILIADVRSDEHFDGRLIPGAVRLPWSAFRYNNTAANEGSLFIGVVEAQRILGRNGVGRTNTIVLYDSVERDGGATASYLFWVLDVLGHENKMILDGGIDAWEAAGYDLVSKPRELAPVVYQAPMEEIQGDALIEGDNVYNQLGDPHYLIIDVRSPDEYIGEKGTRDLQGNALKLGHIPTAVNIDYTGNWVDSATKKIRDYESLQRLYRGIDPQKTLIVYCNSGRRSSFSYFVLRLMGLDDVYTYEPSWKQWGKPANFYPVETAVNRLSGDGLPGTSSAQSRAAVPGSRQGGRRSDSTGGDAPKGGYVSCGG